MTTSFRDANILRSEGRMQNLKFVYDLKDVRLVDCGNGKILKFYRIIANRNINNPHVLIKKGEKGGYIIEGALSQEDESWVDSKSIVGPDCYIGGNGYIEDSMLFHSVRVGNSGEIISSKVMPKTMTTVFGGSMICDCQINGDVVLSGEARLDSCSVEGHLSMTHNTSLQNCAIKGVKDGISVVNDLRMVEKKIEGRGLLNCSNEIKISDRYAFDETILNKKK